MAFVASLILNIFIYARLLIFKGKSKVTYPETHGAHTMSFLKELDNDGIVTFAYNFIYLVLLVAIALFTYFIGRMNESGNFDVIGRSMLLSMPLLQLFSLTTIYAKNTMLRHFVIRGIKDLYEETKDRFLQRHCDVNQ